MPEPSAPARPQILLNSQRQVRAMNRAARAWLSLHADLLRLRDGRLRLLADPPALERRLEAAAAGETTVLFLRQPADRHAPSLRIEPVQLDGAAATRLLLWDPLEAWPDAGLLQQLFGLTPTEAKVAAALAMGHSSRELALDMAVQVNTVQAHVKHLLIKSGARRQAQLVSLILRSAAMRMSPAEEASGRRSPCSSLARTHGPVQA
ncbi:helix-turn-helix transcriptional regulator [Pelomonas sp. V22]|uniref:helix-turn-helix transcriptional regulator n=1 Tax=Pelomonas sp. V22 TaxID=2822139 RepID=UPI0024A9A76E|nr:helix-turn-helix transcriptional regulator [Pelomonas sp. V22]MDI4634124.1 helix-turn-helix transcriptional regulator [Pelomonas sp. V22]